MRLAHLTFAIALAASVPTLNAEPAKQAHAPAASSAKARQLDALYAQYWEESLKLNPLGATYQGDNRYNDQLPDFYSAEFRKQNHEFTARWLKKIESIGDSGLSGQALISYEMFVHDSKASLEGEQYPDWMMPVNQMGSIATQMAQLGNGTGAQPFKTVKDYDNWLKRGRRIPVLVDSIIADMQAGVKAGVVQPRALMTKVVPQYDAIIKDKPQDSLFWGPIKQFPANFSAADKARLTKEYQAMIGGEMMPAFRKLRAYIANDYLPKTRDSVGLDKLPNGAAWYAFDVRQTTTTDLTPDQIHAIGLSEVERIHGEMQQVMKDVGFKGSLQDFFKFMREDKQFQFKSEDDLLKFYRGLEARIMKRIPEQFSLVPKAGFEIRPVEAFRAESAAGGEYQSPSEDGSRPGIFYVNTFDLPSRKTWSAEDLFLHEAIPGHHFQIGIQQELKGVPAFRRFGGNTAYVEGWALYSESLGKSLGVYETPYDYFGRLQDELWRAIRLVTDTGLHSKNWTREQTIDYMMNNSAVSLTDATAEAERYIAWPSQAVAYKVGELTIQRLKKKAQTELGDRFDPRGFHAVVLEDGAVPMSILEQKVDRWIVAKKH
ncbi:DUF885 domain-containing protein [Solilutibacter silvestris]|uniref:DUF885 domain-containing protein n=1 Tax=Solilutibacter silvestris TaxID=1645665 RepID=A0A2K1PXW0_9GAMM|nr:DUF885 family protein [Lysobacter silvestris]PNS07622.1 hypothetical protein Lysil_1798 [Lysobacter silvestris]